MPLSRHFYPLDEVEAALYYTTSLNKQKNALFWAQELILSDCIGEVISVLFKSWLWNTGVTRLQWLINAYTNLSSCELSHDDILLATYQLTTIHCNERDNSLWNILVLTAKDQNKMPDTVTHKTPPVFDTLFDETPPVFGTLSDETPPVFGTLFSKKRFSKKRSEQYFIRALYQGKARCAWWISQYIATDLIWNLLDEYVTYVCSEYADKYKICLSALREYDKLLGYKSDEYDLIIRCAAIIAIAYKNTENTFKPLCNEIDKNNTDILNSLALNVGKRRRRELEIPKECLYGTTLRGKMRKTKTTLPQLYDIIPNLRDCPFWESTEAIIDHRDDDEIEKFYVTYFPDDIPDEWSKQDQEKSHGYGILQLNEVPNLSRYSCKYMTHCPHLAWNTTKEVNTYLEQLNIHECSLEVIARLYKAVSTPTQEDLKKLEPVRKIKTISLS